MNFKRTIKIEDRAPISNWLGDSQVWMKTALEKDQRSGRGRHDVETDSNELNVAHVCTGLAFELALKALAKSEGRPITKKHEAEKNYRNLGTKSQARIKKFVEENTPNTIENLLKYLDERMCHPDRKYWMVGRKGELRGVGFVHGVPGLVIPSLAIVHAEIVEMVGENTFDGWRESIRVGSGRGEHLATAHFDEDGSIRWKITRAGKELGVTTSPALRRINIVCPQCGSSEWQREKEEPDPDDQVTCKKCQISMRAGDVVSWNKERAKS
ncbi:MAG: hypothetical protein OXB94_07035 [Nitrospira sp.]|nr:hypothetical protein [Nitrospira sp.]